MYSRYYPLLLFVFVLLYNQPLFSKSGQAEVKGAPMSMQAEDKTVSTLSNIGNISYWLYNDGQSAIDPTGNAGVTYPRGTAGVIYEDGLVWGARVPGDNGATEIRVGGSTYRTGTQALSDQIYRIRRDWGRLSLVDVVPDAAEYFRIPQSEVTEAQSRQILDQYREDWKNWPVEEGAPFVDRDNNGLYNPVLDENGLPDAGKGDYPGIAGADQVIWFKVNDQDREKSINLYGSEPMGVELQVTVWGYLQPHADRGQAVFKKYKLKNISDYTFEEMYLSQWADPDIGNYSDDIVGCDTSLQMMFSYNGNSGDEGYDAYGLAPAAAGYVLLQGPIIPAEGDSAYYEGEMRAGYKNLPMSSFGYFSAGNTEWTDPVLGDYDGTLQWYNLLRGYISNTNIDNPTPFTHRSTGEATKFPLDGDPLTGTGDIDGQDSNFAPGDRRMLLVSGPFSLNPGEEQEMVVALVGGLGNNNVSSVEVLKSSVKTLREQYGNPMPYPYLSYSYDYPDNKTTTLHIRADLTGFMDVDSCTVSLKPISNTDLPLTVSLYDDGAHDDGLADDGIWSNAKSFQNRKSPHTVDVEVFPGTGSKLYPSVSEGLRLRPRPLVSDIGVSWEDGPQDGKVNPGENIHLSFEVTNPDGENAIDKLEIKKYRTVTLNNGLAPLKTVGDESYYFALSGDASGDSLTFFYELTFDDFREIVASRVALTEVETGQYYRDTIDVVSVKGTTSRVLLMVSDPSLMTNHSYSLVFKEDTGSGELYWNLWDETLHELKYERGAISNDPYYPFPVVDGILIKIGNTEPGMDPDDPWGAENDRWISGVNWGGAEFFGGLDIGKNFFGSTITDPADYKDIVIYWAADTVNNPLTTEVSTMVEASKEQFPDRWSKGQTYRRDTGYQANGTGDIPFAVYDIGQDPPERLNVCFVEDANDGSLNHLWDMGWSNGAFRSIGGREYIYFMASSYNEGADYDDSNYGPSSDVMYGLWPQARGSRPYLSAPFTMYINGADTHVAGDSLVFDSPTTLGDDLANVPQRYYLKQNYPNPFNPVTRINFGLAQNSTVKLRIFNILGQEVRMLINGYLGAGRHDVQWDGRNDQGRLLSSGVYIYKLTAGEFSRSRKMILLK